jgi:hypothetical protein
LGVGGKSLLTSASASASAEHLLSTF